MILEYTCFQIKIWFLCHLIETRMLNEWHFNGGPWSTSVDSVLFTYGYTCTESISAE